MAGSYGQDRQYKNRGMRKHECRDCGETFMATWRASYQTATRKNHCPKCGSTFIEPYSRNAKAEAKHRVTMRDERLPVLESFKRQTNAK